MKQDTFSKTTRMAIRLTALMALLACGALFAQNKAIGFREGMPFSDAVIAGNMLFVAGQEGPTNGKLEGTDITAQTTNAIAAIERIVKKAGFEMKDIVSVTVYIADLADVPKMNEIYKQLMPNPKPARATVQVAGLIGGAKIEISAIAAKQ